MRLLAVAGEDQVGVVNEELAQPLLVRAVDADGRPISGHVVNFRVTAGGGSVFAGAALTDADGRAAERWTLGTSTKDSQRVEVRAVTAGGDKVIYAIFRASARAGAAAQLERVAPDSQPGQPGAPVSIVPAVRVRDRFGNTASDVLTRFRVTGGGGSLRDTLTRTDADGVASAGVWILGPTVGLQTVSVTVDTLPMLVFRVVAIPPAPVAPFRIADDAPWVSPSTTARLQVIDVFDRPVLPALVQYTLTPYNDGSPPVSVVVGEDGTVRMTGPLSRSWVAAFRIRATVNGQNASSPALLSVHPTDKPRIVFRTDHWRLIVPPEWITTALGTTPDFAAALDVGWEGERELLGMSPEEAQTAAQPSNPAVAFQAMTEDSLACGISGNPYRSSRSCFLFPDGERAGQPRWQIIFHELGHNFSIAQQARAFFCQVFCRGSTYVEGDATLLSMWASRRMRASARLNSATRNEMQRQFDADTAQFGAGLRRWERSDRPYSDANEIGGIL